MCCDYRDRDVAFNIISGFGGIVYLLQTALTNTNVLLCADVYSSRIGIFILSNVVLSSDRHTGPKLLICCKSAYEQ